VGLVPHGRLRVPRVALLEGGKLDRRFRSLLLLALRSLSSRFHVSTLLVQTKERRDTACPVIARRLRPNMFEGREGQAKTGGWDLWACGNLGALGLVPSFFRSLGRKKKTYRLLPVFASPPRPPGYPPLPFFASPTHHHLGPRTLTSDAPFFFCRQHNKQPTTTTSHHAPPLTLCCPFGALRRSWCAGHVRQPVPGFVHPQRTHVAATHDRAR